MTELAKNLRRMRLPAGYNQQLLTDAADQLEQAEARAASLEAERLDVLNLLDAGDDDDLTDVAKAAGEEIARLRAALEQVTALVRLALASPANMGSQDIDRLVQAQELAEAALRREP